METEPANDDVGSVEYDYFMVRSSRPAPGHAGTIRGLVEHLATGEKRRFDDGSELLKLLSNWSATA